MSDAFTPPAGVPAVPAAAVRDRSRSRFADLAPPRWFPAAAAGTGLAAALLLVDNQPGIGVPLVVAAALATLLPAVRVDRADRVLVALLAALAVMPALRAAEWLVALDLLAILGLGCLVVVPAREWRSFVVAALSVPLRMLPAPEFLVRGFSRDNSLLPVLRGTVFGAVLVVVFGALFASADAAFSNVVGRLVPDLGLLPVHLSVFLVVTLGLAAAVLANHVPVALPSAPEPRRLRGAEWLVPLVALDLLFAAFVAVQFAVLFGGQDHVLQTAGLTYAEYARSGFFQLLAVTALTLVVVAGAVRWAPDERLLRVLVGVLCLLDGVVLVSAIRRLALYERAFGLSIDRVLAHTIAFWLGVVLVLVVVAGVTRRSGWLPRAVAGTAAGALLVLNVANPEALIARSQVDRYERTGELDALYLGGLSADAVPQILRLPDTVLPCVLQYVAVPDDSWPGYNVSRSRARSRLPEVSSPGC